MGRIGEGMVDRPKTADAVILDEGQTFRNDTPLEPWANRSSKALVGVSTEGSGKRSSIPEMGMGPPIPIGVPSGSLEGIKGDDKEEETTGGKGKHRKQRHGRVRHHHLSEAGPGKDSTFQAAIIPIGLNDSMQSTRGAPEGYVSQPVDQRTSSADEARLSNDNKEEVKGSEGSIVDDGMIRGESGKSNIDSNEPDKSEDQGGIQGPAEHHKGMKPVAGHNSKTEHRAAAASLRPVKASSSHTLPSTVVNGSASYDDEDAASNNETSTVAKSPIEGVQPAKGYNNDFMGGTAAAVKPSIGGLEGQRDIDQGSHLPNGDVAMRSFIAVTVVTVVLVIGLIGSFVCSKESFDTRRSRTSCRLCEDAGSRSLKHNVYNPQERFLPDEVPESGRIDALPPGLRVVPNAFTEAEEKELLCEVYKGEWKASQSGRRKQDYGPQVNFKKNKLKCPERFKGLPQYMDEVLARAHSLLGMPMDYEWHEMVVQEYTADRGSSIALHKDHSWVWADGILDISLGADSIMTFANPSRGIYCDVELPRRSICLIGGEAQSEWLHGIRRGNACIGPPSKEEEEVRISLTLRVLTEEAAATVGGKETIRRSRMRCC
ncbi:alkB, alkylation repair 4 [Perkinsus chesapeaki]|uniref:AlkB, alkylation repair 4 n=1 Tax=Perkinsus chesapeaki TaxID=330153 RepID=A0A7J6LQA9_PERCH|nr:alkB, alkylation repair 4 [Perkinsus chesapeaki]